MCLKLLRISRYQGGCSWAGAAADAIQDDLPSNKWISMELYTEAEIRLYAIIDRQAGGRPRCIYYELEQHVH